MSGLTLSNRLEAACWTAAALFVGFFGNGSSDIITIMRTDPRIHE